MLKRLLGLAGSPNDAIVDALYAEIVAAARQTRPYAQWGVPDTPLGRFEMMSLNMFLFLHRARGADGRLSVVAQEIVDTFFREMDHSLRELGIGDLGVPKRMKKLARMFYGRAKSYGEALEAGDRAALAEALARNIQPDAEAWPESAALADHVFDLHESLARQPDEDLLAGRMDMRSATA
jgi:cytochrome b pre-mRNA-processing protein 3